MPAPASLIVLTRVLLLAAACVIATSRGASTALAGSKTTPPKPRSAVTLDAFIQTVKKHGSPTYFSELMCEKLGMPRSDVPTRVVYLQVAQTKDGNDRSFHVLYDKFDAGPFDPKARRSKRTYPWPKNPVATALVLSASSMETAGEGTYYLKASLDGRLENAFLIRSGPSQAAPILDVSSPEVHERFQNEVDSWLRWALVKAEWQEAEFRAGYLQKKGKR